LRGLNGVEICKRSEAQSFRAGTRGKIRANAPVTPRRGAQSRTASGSGEATLLTHANRTKEKDVKKIRFISILAVLVAVLSFNLASTAFAADTSARTAAVAVAEDLPCYDLWTGCLAGGGSANFCEGMWCGCMQSHYGYICSANVS
jgi:hypothetical protein